jgi:hypothetical protein
MLADAVAPHVVVRPLFTNIASGRRAAMFIVDVPDDASSTLLSSLSETLRCHDAVEFAGVPADRRPV